MISDAGRLLARELDERLGLSDLTGSLFRQSLGRIERLVSHGRPKITPYREFSFIAHGWRYFRRRGLRAAVRTMINRFVYGFQKFVVYRTCLAGQPAADHARDIIFRLATPADLDHLAEFEPYGLGTSQRAYVKYDNDWLFVACHGDRIVATRRYGRNVPPGALMSRVLQLEPRQVWSADAFCLPEYRNQGLNRHFGLFTMRFLASQGYTEEFGVIVATNIPSLRSVLHRGSQFVHFVSYSRILFYERLLVSNDVPTELTGLTQLTPKAPRCWPNFHGLSSRISRFRGVTEALRHYRLVVQRVTGVLTSGRI